MLTLEQVNKARRLLLLPSVDSWLETPPEEPATGKRRWKPRRNHRPCEDCKQPLADRGPNAKRCGHCAHAKRRERSRAHYVTQHPEAVPRPISPEALQVRAMYGRTMTLQAVATQTGMPIVQVRELLRESYQDNGE